MRIVLFSILFFALSGPAGAEYRCGRAKTGPEFQAALDAELSRIQQAHQSSEASHKAEIDLKSQALIEKGVWSEADRAAYFDRVANLPAFQAREIEKRDYGRYFPSEVQMAMTLGAANPRMGCEHAANAVSFLAKIAAASEAQWLLMKTEMPK
ncbi:hypothetical protein M2650_00160 [Luteimonas sp. SX5]|uniref:DUF1311 domain-containing protein n=1 Tax=Luteimonas galliterrae TaxID=2940486 RepID=A0ABT0MFL6_9GAMM|nr:hypothetical protein [Luteimonas galliterrae]MCL1633064.1 hypothetical protein [Luteimonas galliterrae]